MQRFLGLSASGSRPPSREPAVQTYEEAVSDGLIIFTASTVACKCSPSVHHPAGWGPRASEWKAHCGRETHQLFARSQPGRRSLMAVPAEPGACPSMDSEAKPQATRSKSQVAEHTEQLAAVGRARTLCRRLKACWRARRAARWAIEHGLLA